MLVYRRVEIFDLQLAVGLPVKGKVGGVDLEHVSNRVMFLSPSQVTRVSLLDLPPHLVIVKK